MKVIRGYPVTLMLAANELYVITGFIRHTYFGFQSSLCHTKRSFASSAVLCVIFSCNDVKIVNKGISYSMHPIWYSLFHSIMIGQPLIGYCLLHPVLLVMNFALALLFYKV